MTEWSRFELNGWTFIANIPDSDSEPQQWNVNILDPSGEPWSIIVPMDYAPRFGPDAGDVFAMNSAVETFIAERGIESDAEPPTTI